MHITLAVRFMRHVTVTDSCWLWTGNVTERGYGHFSVAGKARKAHRIAYRLFVGPIPPGKQIHHRCGNTVCVRPDHLEAVSAREHMFLSNNACAVNAAKTHCPEGHPLSGDNLCVDGAGQRSCKRCREQRQQRQRLSDKRGRSPLAVCGRGHSLTEDSVRYYGAKRQRRCMACHREYERERARRLRLTAS